MSTLEGFHCTLAVNSATLSTQTETSPGLARPGAEGLVLSTLGYPLTGSASFLQQSNRPHVPDKSLLQHNIIAAVPSNSTQQPHPIDHTVLNPIP